MRKLIALAMALALAISGCAAAENGGAGDEYLVEILALNVGKADALLVSIGETRFLIDAGRKGDYDALEAALSAEGVTELAGVFMTHTDKDHSGGLKKLGKSGIAVGAWYASEFFDSYSGDEHPMVEAAAERASDVTWLRAGDVLDIDGVSRFEVLGPLALSRDDDDNSLVLRLVTPEGTALFTGDMEYFGEALLLDSGSELAAQYLKVGHHGKADASSDGFLRSVSPEVAVISTDEEEPPASQTLAALADVRATVYVTGDYDIGVRVRLKGGHAEYTP